MQRWQTFSLFPLAREPQQPQLSPHSNLITFFNSLTALFRKAISQTATCCLCAAVRYVLKVIRSELTFLILCV